MLKNVYYQSKVNISNELLVQRFDKGLIRFSFNFSSQEDPLWIHIGISFEAGDYLKQLLSTTNLTVHALSFLDLVLEAGFKFPLDRVIYIDESDESESLFEYIDNHIRSKPHPLNDEDFYLTYQITFDIKEKFDKYIKENPGQDSYVDMYNMLINSDFTYYKIENGSFVITSYF